MTRYEANQILDQIRDGISHPTSRAIECLNITGDTQSHERLRSAGVAEEEERKDWRFRVRERQILVARSKE